MNDMKNQNNRTKEKNIWKKGTVIGLLCVLFVQMLAGCQLPGSEAEPVEKGMLKVGRHLEIPSMCYLSEDTNKLEGFDVELAGKLAEKMGLELEIVDTSEENLLKSLDADLYDCVISSVGLSDWNEAHYSHTSPYADISSVKEKTGQDTEYTELAVFTKKGNPMTKKLEENLQKLKKDGTLKELSQKYFEKDITVAAQTKE